MATMFKRAMLYLGLGPDDEYDDHVNADDRTDHQGGSAPVRATAPRQGSVSIRGAVHADPLEASGAVRTMPREQEQPAVTLRPRPSVVRPIPGPIMSAKPYAVAPSSFNEAQDVADKFKEGQPVIINLQEVERDLSRRLIDFASGLCYGLGGQMDRVAHQVYLLTPNNVEIPAEEKRRLQERGLHD